MYGLAFIFFCFIMAVLLSFTGTVTGFIPDVVNTDTFKVNFAEKPEHAVLFIIDGLSYKVWDRMELPTLKKMIIDGVLVEKIIYLQPSIHIQEFMLRFKRAPYRIRL